MAHKIISAKDVQGILESTKGRFFTVHFVKQDGTQRVMTCRTGVKKYLRGGKPAYNFNAKGLTPVYEPGNGYRSVAWERVTRIAANGDVHEVL